MTAVAPASGCSGSSAWPAPGISTTVIPGPMSSCSILALAGGAMVSAMGWTTRIGARPPAHQASSGVACVFVLVGMWFERFNIIVPGLAHGFYPYTWGTYVPTVTDSMIIVGSFAWFFLLFLGFIRVMPSLSIVEVKEVLPHPLKHGTHGGGD